MIFHYYCSYALLIRRLRHVCWFTTILAVCFPSLTGRLLASQSVELTWTASPSYDIVYYKIYYGTQSGVYTDVISAGDVSAVVIPALQDGQAYFFAVSAVDGNGYESTLSPEVVYSVPGPSATTLQVVTSTAVAQAVDAFWTPSADSDAVAYTVSYGTQSGVYTNFVTFDFTNDGVVAGLVPGNTYYFIVTPIDSLGESLGSSAEVSYLAPLSAPITLSAAALTTGGGVQLSWTNLAGQSAAGYNIFYGTQSQYYTARTSCGPQNSCAIQGLPAGVTYYFVVAAVDDSGNQGLFSNEASAAVLAAPPPSGIGLRVQTLADANGRPSYLQISSITPISGAWEMDYSPDLVNWTPYYYGIGDGGQDGPDVEVGAGIDPNTPQMFFRVIQ